MIRLIDYIDIILVTYLLYKTYKVLRGTVAMRVFLGILFFVVAWLVVNFVFQMQLLGGIMNQIVNVGAIALIVLFQDEIRQTLSRIGTGIPARRKRQTGRRRGEPARRFGTGRRRMGNEYDLD